MTNTMKRRHTNKTVDEASFLDRIVWTWPPMFQCLSAKIGRSWMRLGRNLKMRESVLENILDNSPHDQQEKISNMLIHWLQDNGENATYLVLGEALQNSGRLDLQEETHKYAMNRPVDEAYLLDLSQCIQQQWLNLGRNLKVESDVLEYIGNNYSRDQHDAFRPQHEVLRHWLQDNGEKATYEVLGEALRKTGRVDLQERTNQYATEIAVHALSSQPISSSTQGSNSDDRYNMTHIPIGKCLILTYDTFPNTKRPGNDKDIEKLKDLFGKILDFEVHDKLNLNLEETTNVITAMAEEEHHDCLVVFVCSHGDKESFHTSDGQRMTFETLMEKFKPQNCSGLSGKPKIFFFNNCLGPKLQRFFEVDGIVPDLVANDIDFFICFSTLPDHASLRDTNNGTIFVQHVYKCIKDKHQTEHLSDIMTYVNNSMHKQLAELARTSGNYECGQVIRTINQLRKKVYFPSKSN